MLDQLKIRESRPADSAAIESLYPEAFPDEDLLPLVRSLLNDPVVTTSLVAAIDVLVVGHVLFTKCGVVGTGVTASLLGPLAVAPAWQKKGIGSAIVLAGLRWLENSDANLVLVLGDPAYYGRLGFLPEADVEPPYPLPPEWDGAWQSHYLGKATTPNAGKLSVPSQWLHPELWAP
jgi:putative acetyltransferase